MVLDAGGQYVVDIQAEAVAQAQQVVAVRSWPVTTPSWHVDINHIIIDSCIFLQLSHNHAHHHLFDCDFVGFDCFEYDDGERCWCSSLARDDVAGYVVDVVDDHCVCHTLVNPASLVHIMFRIVLTDPARVHAHHTY